jgi:hypothetical protein
LSANFPIQNGLKPLLLNFALEYSIRKLQENYVGQNLNGIHQLLIYDNDVNVLGCIIDNIKKQER